VTKSKGFTVHWWHSHNWWSNWESLHAINDTSKHQMSSSNTLSFIWLI